MQPADQRQCARCLAVPAQVFRSAACLPLSRKLRFGKAVLGIRDDFAENGLGAWLPSKP
jgi:hypothetical protein